MGETKPRAEILRDIIAIERERLALIRSGIYLDERERESDAFRLLSDLVSLRNEVAS